MSTTSIFSPREPFTASQTATKQPKRTAAKVEQPKPPGIVDKLLSAFASDEEKLAQQRRELEEKKEQAAQQIREYKSLKQARDKIALRLESADRQCEEAKARREELASTLARDAWGQPIDGYRSQPWVGYQNLLALDAAIADFPNARKHIEAELEKAQDRLAEFGKQHGLPADVD